MMASTIKFEPVPTMAELSAQGITPEVLFWVGCAASFDEKIKNITRSFVSILQKTKIVFAVLGTQESCTGDPAKRTGNEFLFQMQALSNIQILNGYKIKNIVTTCPHCFNTLKNEYPSLGGNYKVQHHTEFLQDLLKKGILKIKGGRFKGKVITYHDPCYLGRANNIYQAPRSLIQQIDAQLVEIKKHKKNADCCGAGGGQLFKEPEKGQTQVNENRATQVKQTKADIVCTTCPFCKIMLEDTLQKKTDIHVVDIAEILNENAEI